MTKKSDLAAAIRLDDEQRMGRADLTEAGYRQRSLDELAAMLHAIDARIQDARVVLQQDLGREGFDPPVLYGHAEELFNDLVRTRDRLARLIAEASGQR